MSDKDEDFQSGASEDDVEKEDGTQEETKEAQVSDKVMRKRLYSQQYR
jgi:hypothetical protein